MIGIFDSGIGGLTVAGAFMEQMPEYDFVYFGDTARIPYGTRSQATVIEYALQDTDFLMKMGANLIVMACNTASSVAVEPIRNRFDVPLFDVITPAAEQSVTVSKSGRIGVIGTRATINSGVYAEKILALNPDARVHSNPCPLLVPLVEEGWLKKPETVMIVKKYLHPLKTRQIDTLILGCTHYPILAGIIQRKMGKNVTIIDSSGVVDAVKRYLQDHPELEKDMGKSGDIRLFVSDVTDQFKRVARTILQRDIPLELVKI